MFQLLQNMFINLSGWNVSNLKNLDEFSEVTAIDGFPYVGSYLWN